jgi:hypothetical protein
VGFLIACTKDGSHMAYIPGLDITVGPTVEITFDEAIPSHAESYFAELHLRDDIIDVTNTNIPKAPADYHYLVGTYHIDDEDGTTYIVTRIIVISGYIAAYRASVKADGTRNKWEDNSPIHVEDIVRMTENSSDTITNRGHGTKTVSSVRSKLQPVRSDLNNPPGQRSTLYSNTSNITAPHLIGAESVKRIAATITPQQDAPGILENVDDASPHAITLRSRTASALQQAQFNLSDTRERKLRKPLNVTTLGNIVSQASISDVVSNTLLQSDQQNDIHSCPYTKAMSDSKDLAKSAYNDTPPSSTYQAFTAMVQKNEFDIDFVPQTYKQAMQSNNSHNWQHAVDKELQSIKDNNVFTFVDRPHGVKLQTGRFLFKVKYTGSSTIYKARLIAHGFKQLIGSDYWETYAPVSSSIATRIFLTMCASFNMKIHQMDIDTAFLIADLVEDIYMEPPIGMNVPQGKVLKLHKCLYGLKQSPRYFNQHLVSTLLNLGFENFENERCLFKKIVKDKLVLASIYVDDILIACEDDDITQDIKRQLRNTYKMKDMGEMDWYLGMRCKRNPQDGSFKLDQTKYVEDILIKFELWLGKQKPRTVPMEPNLVLSKWTKEYDDSLSDKDKYIVEQFPYRQVIGSLLYASIWTRPDISFAVGKLAKFNNHPTMQAIHAAQWLLQYMRCTKNLGLTFSAGNMRISQYVDSSFADIVIDRRSTAGEITFLGKSPIQWDSFVCDNYSIPCSVGESEYVAACEGAKVMMANRNLLNQLGYPQDKMLMFEDNQAAIAIALQEASTRKTKHVELQVHYIRDLVKRGLIVMIHIPTRIQLADIFTKPLNDDAFYRHLYVILGAEPSGDLQVYLNALDQHNVSVNVSDEYENY